jgi:hypothetical protein
MIKHTLVLLLVLPVALHAGAVHAQEPIPAASPALTAEFLLETLSNRDESIRREAFRRLKQDESIDALPRLVDAIRSGDEGTATRAALAFVGRLDFLRRNTAPNAKQRLLLSDEDRQHLAAVAELLSDRDVEHWRWYLAESVLEQIVPSEFVEYLPELTLAVNEAHPMRQFAALRGLLLVDAEHAAEVKPALLRALRQRGRPRFVGIYLRYDRTIENNRVAFTSDIWSAPANSKKFTF